MILLKNLINEIMKKVLYGDNALLEKLRNQYKSSKISNFEKSDIGCFVDFKVKFGELPLTPKDIIISDVFLHIEGMDEKVGIILFIRDGFLSMLELHTYADDPLPDSFENYSLIYNDNDVRNFNTFIN